MPSLWFILPVHGRFELAAVCLRQLARTCDALEEEGLHATAVVIADADNHRELRRRVPGLIGNPRGRAGRFAAIERANDYLSMRFNDGIELACSAKVNPEPADFVVPIGSDDWVDHRVLLRLPETTKTVVGFQRMSFVREDGREISSAFVKYRGGCGIRIYPRQLLQPFGYRPADEDRRRGCDTSILTNVCRAHHNVIVSHRDVHDRQIVDWKSPGANLNGYADVAVWKQDATPDPFRELAGSYPAEAIAEMREVYGR